MHDKLRIDLHNEAYEIEADDVDGFPVISKVVDLHDIDTILDKHSYLKLGDLLNDIAPYQMVALKAGTTVNNYDFLGTAEIALKGGVHDSFKNISDNPFEMNVAKIDTRMGMNAFTDDDGKIIDDPTIFIFVN